MIRTTITALTLAAIAMIAIATAAPVLAAPSSSAPAATVEAADSTCVIDIEAGALPCLDSNWSLGGLSNTDTPETDRYDEAQPAISTALRTGDVLTQTGTTSSSTTTASFVDEARIRSGRPDDTISEDTEWIMDAATAGASILSLDHMMIALAVVLGMIGTIGITTVVLVTFAWGRRNR
jgi:hypothetical protein